MKWHRIKAVLLHSYYHATHSQETWIDLFWFTSIQFVVFGFISQIIAQNNPEVAKNLIMGFFLWETVRIGQYCITVSVLWEVWSRSLSNLFISPLTLTEMMLGQAIAGTIKTALVMSTLTLISLAFFQFPLAGLGGMLLVYFVVLLGFAFAAGLFITGLILRFGTEIQSMAWGMIYFFQPISAVFYPVAVLPDQIRWLAYTSPITYVMEAARQQLNTGIINWPYLGAAVGLTVVYFGCSSWFLARMYQWARKTGAFARLGS